MSLKHLPLTLATLLICQAARADLPELPPTAPNAVPEPETLVLLAVAGLAGWLARRGGRK